MKTTVLAEKLRRLGRRKPELQAVCDNHASRLDMAMHAYGDTFSKQSKVYQGARLYYARAIGRAYDFGADRDLEVVDAEPV